jgi:hypothetical protein
VALSLLNQRLAFEDSLAKVILIHLGCSQNVSKRCSRGCLAQSKKSNELSHDSFCNKMFKFKFSCQCTDQFKPVRDYRVSNSFELSNFFKEISPIVGMTRDASSQFIWVYTESSFFKYRPNDETRFGSQNMISHLVIF